MFSVFAPPQRKSNLGSVFSTSIKMPRKVAPITNQIETTAKWLYLLNALGTSSSLRVSIVSILFVFSIR